MLACGRSTRFEGFEQYSDDPLYGALHYYALFLPGPIRVPVPGHRVIAGWSVVPAVLRREIYDGGGCNS